MGTLDFLLGDDEYALGQVLVVLVLGPSGKVSDILVFRISYGIVSFALVISY